MNNLFSTALFADAPGLPLTDFYIVKYNADNMDLPIEAFKNGEPIKPEDLRVGVLLRLLNQAKEQTEIQALITKIKWDETVARWESHQYDQLDKTFESERCAQ
jgi:hypothetical protein